MRVVMTTDTVGGVWTFTKELASELLAKGCAVAMISLGRVPTQDQRAWADTEKAQWGENFRFEELDVPLEWMQENGRAFQDAAPVLTRMIEGSDGDVFVSSQYCFGALECNIPRIVVAHSDVLSWAEACRPDGLPQSAWLNRYCELVAEGLDHADAVVAPTHWMRVASGWNCTAMKQRRWAL